MNRFFTSNCFAITKLIATFKSCSQRVSFILLCFSLSFNSNAQTPKNGPKGVCYVEVNNNNLVNTGCYTLTSGGQQLFDIAIIFAANINYDVAQQKAVLFNNSNVSTVLANAATIIQPLQAKGIKVLLSILGNHQGAGFCNFKSRAAAHDFAQQLSDAVTTYGLDGIDFDDEYADYGTNGTGQPNDSSFVLLLSELRSLMPSKLITFYYYGPAASRLSWNGQKAGDFVNNSWNAVYGTFSVPNVPGLSASQLAPAAVSINSTSSSTTQSLATQTVNGGYGYYLFYNLPGTNVASYLSPISNILNGSTTSLTAGCLQPWPPTTTVPAANFTASSTSITTGQSVTFTNSSTNATSYSWTFTGGTPATSTATNPVVTYSTAGTYTVALTATNANGSNTNTKTNYITVSTAPPAGNRSVVFDGVNEYINAGTINLSGSALSMEGWIKPAAFKTASPYISSIMGIENGTSTALLRFGDASLANNKLQFVLTIGGVQRKLASAATFTAGTWYHIAATYNGSSMRIYINGTLNATSNVSGTVTANSTFNIGYSYENLRCLNGQVDEIRVWKKALTQAQVQANMCTVSPTSTSLEAYWKLNEGAGLTAADATGHNHTGTLTNMETTDWSTNVPSSCGTAASRIVKPVAVEEILDVTQQITAYPNPASRGNLVRINVPSGRGNLTLYSGTGTVIKSQKIVSRLSDVNIQSLSAGVYTYIIDEAGGKRTTGKIIVQ